MLMQQSAPRRVSVILALCACTVPGVWTSRADAAQRWMLIYYRQIGNNVNGGAYTVENHLQLENGTKAAGVGVTNQFNTNTAIWGNTDVDGYRRVDPDESAYRDVRIYQPGVPTDQSPNFYHFDPNNPFGRYSFETHWMKVTDDTRVTPFPTTPAYHYDLVAGINSASYVTPPGYSSDAFALVTWTAPFYQTFVVPAGINRIVSGKVWLVHVGPAQYQLSIHQDNGGGIGSWPQVGPTAISRVYHPTEFTPVAVSWAIDAVPVTPGQRYAIKALIPGGSNLYATTNDTYAQGTLYIGTDPVPGRDMLAVLVGVGYDFVPPTINRSPAALNPAITEGENHPDQSFTVSNSGAGTLSYTITDNVGWLSVNPAAGDSTGSPNNHTVDYTTASLNPGNYNATITITAAGASNTPQTIAVNLTVNASPFAPADFDEDGDVDLADFGHFQACYTAPGVTPAPGCVDADLDGDGDVDPDDFGLFQGCLTGADQPADPGCAD